MAIRAENIPAEPVNPIIIQACSWCKKDELHIPLQDCMSCSHNRQDDETVWCQLGTTAETLRRMRDTGRAVRAGDLPDYAGKRKSGRHCLSRRRRIPTDIVAVWISKDKVPAPLSGWWCPVGPEKICRGGGGIGRRLAFSGEEWQTI
jgi:hypothetical protein